MARSLHSRFFFLVCKTEAAVDAAELTELEGLPEGMVNGLEEAEEEGVGRWPEGDGDVTEVFERRNMTLVRVSCR